MGITSFSLLGLGSEIRCWPRISEPSPSRVKEVMPMSSHGQVGIAVEVVSF
jgi:hypothetical protein